MDQLIKANLYEDNKYFRWYWNICERAMNREIFNNIYIERHHIYPKSIFGKNDILVKLTAKEHYMAHLLLWQGFRMAYGTDDIRTRKMAYAFTCMNRRNESQFRYSSKIYSLVRTAYSEAAQNRPGGMLGKTHSTDTKIKMSNAAKGKKKSPTHCKNMSLSRIGNIPWNKNGIRKPKRSRYQSWVDNYGEVEAHRRYVELNSKIKKSNQGKIPWNKGLKNVQDYSNRKPKVFSDEMILQISVNNSGKNNPMYGRSAYDIWVEKYGKEEADKRRIIQNQKISATKQKNKELKTIRDNNMIEYKLPHTCPHCGNELIIENDIHLTCINNACPGKKMELLKFAIGVLNMAFFGPKMIQRIYNCGITNVFELFDKKKFNKSFLVSTGLPEAQTIDRLLNEVRKIKSLDLSQVILMMNIEDLGKTTSAQIAKMIAGVKYTDYGLQKKHFSAFSPGNKGEKKLIEIIEYLNKRNIEVIFPEEETPIREDDILLVYTGSPKSHGFETKSEFDKIVRAYGCCETGDMKIAQYLITDSYEYNTSKVKKAKELNIKIMTYSDFINFIKEVRGNAAKHN